MRRSLSALAAAASVVAGFTAFAPPEAEAKPRPARCVIDAAGAPRWTGPCSFDARPGGSFTVTPARGRFGNGTTSLSLDIIRPGLAEVRGLTAQGINSRWGPARRSPRDRACWIGTDFSLCVY
jgi:hypothetical protein